MERFAIINDKIRLNLYNICRLCGIDNPCKIKILDSLKTSNDSEEEPCLSKKIECVVGIKVKRNDQMPQSICTLCADKINDFFEYREMCGATNIQTRKLLGIPLEPKRKRPTDKEIKAEGESILGLGIEDEDDNKLSVKLSGKHRVKGRPKKKGNSTKKKVQFKDEDEVKLELDEIKDEIQPVKISSKNVGKRLKIDLKKNVDATPLLTLKEPNKRERRREIDAQKLERRRIREEQKREIEEKKRQIELAKQILEQKKLEKKRKRKNSDPEPPVKKLKQELEVNVTPLQFCTICSEMFATGDLLSNHLRQSHTVTISAFGCSSCAESFKSLDEEKDHELWHSLSKTSYMCPICNVAFDKISIFTRHVTLCKPFNLTPTVTNIHCDKCSQEFLTQNLYQWHKCFVKPNGMCWHCNRIFVKASTLFKHTFKCSSQGTDSTRTDHVAITPTNNDPKKKRSRTVERESHIKSEPEANLDADVPSASHMLTSDMLPVVVLTKTIFKPNHSFAINTDDMSIKTENDIDFEDNSHMDEPFRDADDSDDNDDADQLNGAETAIDHAEASDDDVILIENNEEPVLVNGSPSSGAKGTVASKQFVLPIVIKREPVDTYEVLTSPVYSPTKTIKSEPLDENAEVAIETERQHSPKRASLKNRKSKKSTHKTYKEKQHLVHIKQEPIDPDDVFRTHDMGSAIVSLPTTNLLETNIKQEPIRPGYDDDFDPVLAMNIKKEPGLMEDSSSSRMPSLRLIISKKHGTLNSKLISAQEDESDTVETSPSKAAKAKRVKDKRLYRKPALLAEKIRQEMVARMSRDKENEMTSPHDEDETTDFTVPVIARVLDANTISDLPLVRVKIEPKSPYRSPSHLDSEPILDELAEDHVPDYLQDPIDSLRYNPFNVHATSRFHLSSVEGNASNSTMTSGTVGMVNVDHTSIATDSEELKSLLDIDSLCGLDPAVITELKEMPLKEGPNVQSGLIKSAGADAANDDIMELAGMTLSEFMKPPTSNNESNDRTTLEATDFSDHPASTTDLIESSFDPIPFNETSDDPTFSLNQNSFKMTDANKVSYEEINEMISTLPLSVEPELSPKETADKKRPAFSDSSSNSNELNCHSSDESHTENSGACSEMLANDTLKSTDAFLANGGGDSHDTENQLLKSPLHDNTDYELNSVQTLTTSAIHEQLHSLLEDISEDSLSCDIDLDDKTVDWEWESKLLGD
ncbi:hypothetical protein HA402_003418 [Bradysia odoriphaga]|nr:hypothetical protein HA402_003418 [Bradysia odoriphaga]